MPAQVVSSTLLRLANMSPAGLAADGSLAAACAALAALFACKAPGGVGWQPLEATSMPASGSNGSRPVADLLIMLSISGGSAPRAARHMNCLLLLPRLVFVMPLTHPDSMSR